MRFPSRRSGPVALLLLALPSLALLVPRPPGAFIIYPGSSEPVSPPLDVGYRPDSDSLGLDDLIAIANSVQPYTPENVPTPSAGPEPAATASSTGASVSIAQFTDAGWGNTAIDANGAVVIASPDVSPPTFLRLGTPPDQLPHRYGFYEIEVTTPAPITHYSVGWTEETPAGSRVEMSTGATDYPSGPGMSEPNIVRSDSSADMTLARPAEHIGVTFQLYSGIGADPADPGPSPRLTGVTISSPDTDSLLVAPLAPPPNWANPDATTIAIHGPPHSGPIPPVGTIVQAPALPPLDPLLPPQDRPPVWSTNPTLATVSGESYKGRIVLELHQNAADDQTIFIPGTMTQPQFRQQALAALQSQTSPESTPATWPDIPMIGNSASDAGPYLGRVVVELWDSTANVAVTAVGASGADLVQQALQDLTADGP